MRDGPPGKEYAAGRSGPDFDACNGQKSDGPGCRKPRPFFVEADVRKANRLCQRVK